MKIVCTIFAPFLVAIGIRLVLMLLGLIIYLLKDIIGFFITALSVDEIRDFSETIAGFKTFLWNESWFFWVLVIIRNFYSRNVHMERRIRVNIYQIMEKLLYIQ